MINREHELPVRRQAQLLELSKSAVYYRPVPVSDGDLALMRRIDELHLDHPFAGSRMLKRLLQNDGFTVGRTHVRTLMRRMGIEAIYRRPRTSRPHPGHRVFPYLLWDRSSTGRTRSGRVTLFGLLFTPVFYLVCRALPDLRSRISALRGGRGRTTRSSRPADCARP